MKSICPPGRRIGREAALHLDFRNDRPPFRAGAGKGGERGRGHHGDGPAETAKVTARDVVLLVPHDDGVHDKETSPWQPQSVLLRDEWSALKVQSDGDAPVGHQVKTGEQMWRMSARMNRFPIYLFCQLNSDTNNKK